MATKIVVVPAREIERVVCKVCGHVNPNGSKKYIESWRNRDWYCDEHRPTTHYTPGYGKACANCGHPKEAHEMYIKNGKKCRGSCIVGRGSKDGRCNCTQYVDPFDNVDDK